MTNGLLSSDSAIGIRPPEIKAPEPQNFTPLPEFGRPTMAEPPRFEEPTTTPQIDKLMADILAQGKVKNPEEAVNQVKKNLPKEVKKPQGFIARIIEWIKNLFRNLFK
ncbi:MAG: hypothetical protein V1803_01035 [Candidatus Roizmanbacteria bacterium]